MAEFKVALKSVLINAPIDHGMNIHVIGDKDAYDSLPDVFNETQILTWKTRQQINVHTYDITNLIPTIRKWQAGVSKKHNKIGDGERLHTIGTFFRWFAADVINASGLQFKYVVYMDTDVVIMGNLAELIPLTNYEDVSFQWSRGMCAGFMLLNLEKQVQDRELLLNMTDYHVLIQENKTYTQEQVMNVPILHSTSGRRGEMTDQSMYELLNVTYPERVSVLPEQWDFTVTEHYMSAINLDQHRPEGLGQMHFNGQGRTKEAYFLTHGFLLFDQYNKTSGLAKYYVSLPWNWAKYMVENKASTSQPPFQVRLIEHRHHMNLSSTTYILQ